MGDQSSLKAPNPAQEEHTRDPNGHSSISRLTGNQPDVIDHQQRADVTAHDDSTPRRPRRFLVQPTETTSRSSQTPRGLSPDKTEQPGDVLRRPVNRQARDSQPRRRFLPEPVETTKASNRGAHSAARASEQKAPVGPRRFKPEVIETDRRSVGGKTVDLPLRSKARAVAAEDCSSQRPEASHDASRFNPKRTPFSGPPESKFSYASLLRRQEGRRHSFRVPELPSIPSNSSEDSDESSKSPSLSPSPESARPLPENQRSANLSRESCDGEFSEYLLSLAAQSAQKQLEEQALAAFPNEQVYEPVDHFAIDEDEMDWEQDSVYPQAHHIKSRRQSSADLSWELEYLRQHKEEAQMRLRAMVSPRNPHITSAGQATAPKSNLASPPMLGDDIVLPQSLSPEGTMCDNANGEGGAQTAADPCSGCGGLWCAASQPAGGRGAGLWMGTCRKGDGHERDSHVLTGIMTPMPQAEGVERDPFTEIFTNREGLADQMDRERTAGVHSLSKALEDEFHDGFVTQIYNYLSLGYPCVARYYDYELSRISGIDVEELRRDDQQTDAKGYVVAPDNDFAVPCMRWKALRLYIREWARQQPFMPEDETGLEAWGMPERRGSWAI